MPQSTWSPRRLRTLIRREVDAEQAVTAQQSEWRSFWWATTWALAAVPRAEWAEAQRIYVEATEHTADHAKARRSTGQRLSESGLATTLPAPRMAIAAARALGRSPSASAVADMVERMSAAEQNELSLREFSQQITGRPWTNAPENLTEADEDAVVDRVIERRPRTVATRLATAAPRAVVDVEEHPRVQQARSARYRERLEETGLDRTAAVMEEMADAADANYRRREFGTDDPDSQWVVGMTRDLVLHDTERGIRGATNNADWIGSLNGLITVATAIRDRAAGTTPTWTSDERAWLSELGIDTTGLVTR